jgi:hypothetical protein
MTSQREFVHLVSNNAIYISLLPMVRNPSSSLLAGSGQALPVILNIRRAFPV